jgi:phytoene dehydrogenase-like protein
MYQIDPDQLEGTTWAEQKEKRAEDLIDVLEERVPGIRGHIIDRYVMCPDDLEPYFFLAPGTGGLSGPTVRIDQMYSMRVPYRSSVKRLYQTGASVHPMGGVLGLPGFNTARIIRQDLEKGTVKLS